MIFGKNRRDEEWNQAVRGLETELKEIKESLEKVIVYSKDREEAIGSWQDPVQKLGDLEERQKELERQIRRQSDSFEDLLEEIQEERGREEELREERRGYHQKEQALIALLILCREQMELLEKQIQKDESMEGEKLAAWQRQFHAMAQERKRLMRPCGMEETGQEGEKVDYEIHEVLSVEETTDGEKADTVVQVYSRGFVQGGHVIKKAKVAAYRQTGGKGGAGEENH